MRIRQIILPLFAAMIPFVCPAQSSRPSVAPTAIYTDDDGTETETTTDFAGQAPLTVTFRANPTAMEDYSPTYEWHFRMEGEAKDLMVRYEENTQYTFTTSGTTRVTLLVSKGDTGERLDSVVIRVTVSESKLSFSNAFSPNGDGINDIYKAKDYQSLVEFHAYIFNRWGQKLYEWTDPADGWDGTYHGKDVKDGVYFVLVKAKGADGRTYNIRRDVNLLRGYTERTTTN
ncbi:MAG: gliding motility-associated C-terminal domain-containing protein [Prevotella sp.]|nr:gliding motility-associated C-terminal domain-containing protein [Prevotella sp.]